jgi:hypothetical protein
MKPMRIGVLTGGGDAPGTNAVIRALVASLEHAGAAEVLGIGFEAQAQVELITSPAGTADTMETLAPVALGMAAMRRVAASDPQPSLTHPVGCRTQSSDAYFCGISSTESGSYLNFTTWFCCPNAAQSSSVF